MNDHTPLGARRPRTEDRRLLVGRGRYLADLPAQDVLHAAFVRSPYAHARLDELQLAASQATEGVYAVLTAMDLPHTPLVDNVQIDRLRKTPQPALVVDRARYVGEPVAIILAASRAQAEDGVDAVQATWMPLPAVTDARVALQADAPSIGDLPPSPSATRNAHNEANLLYDQTRRDGDPDIAFARAALVVEQRFSFGRVTAAPLEGRAIQAAPDKGTGKLTVHASTQSPHLLRRKLAACMDMGETAIDVVTPDVGGAFGQKIPATGEEVAVALAARATGKTVRWVEDRRENLISAPQGKDQQIDLALAFDKDGHIEAIRADVVGGAGGYSHNSASALIEPYLSAGLLAGPYQVENVHRRIRATLTNTPPIAPYRGVGWTASHTARELLIDRAARTLDIEPNELRRRNLIPDDAYPYHTESGMIFDSGSHHAALNQVERRIGADQFRERQHSARRDGTYLGLGITSYVEPSGWGSRGALESSWSFASHDAVRLTIEPSGEVVAAIGTPSQGQGHATALAQLIASELQVEPSQVQVRVPNTADAPISTAGTRASRVATVVGGALVTACVRLRQRLHTAAAFFLQTEESALEVSQGHIAAGDHSLSFKELVRRMYFDPSVRAVLDDPSLTTTAFHDPPHATYSNGCVAVIVEVDLNTGVTKPLEAVFVEDCGTVLNEMIVEGQMLGAFAQGVGMALFEHTEFDDDGQPSNDAFNKYLLPSASELPHLQLGHEYSPSPTSIRGIKGMGESGAIAVPAAVVCAIADAVAPFGVAVDRLPVKADHLADQLESRRFTAEHASGVLPR